MTAPFQLGWAGAVPFKAPPFAEMCRADTPVSACETVTVCNEQMVSDLGLCAKHYVEVTGRAA